MAEENFTINLLRLVSAQQMLSLGLQAAREMYGKSYFALGVAEKVALDQTVNQMIAANYQNLTPAYLAAQTQSRQWVSKSPRRRRSLTQILRRFFQ